MSRSRSTHLFYVGTSIAILSIWDSNNSANEPFSNSLIGIVLRRADSKEQSALVAAATRIMAPFVLRRTKDSVKSEPAGNRERKREREWEGEGERKGERKSEIYWVIDREREGEREKER